MELNLGNQETGLKHVFVSVEGTKLALHVGGPENEVVWHCTSLGTAHLLALENL